MTATEKAPSPSVVVPHFVAGALCFLVLTVLLAFSVPSFQEHYFTPELLCITHLAVLGWITMIIFGALYQLVPVILSTHLFSEGLAKLTFVLFLTGTIGLSCSFWQFASGPVIETSAIVTLAAVGLFAINIAMSMRQADKWTIEGDFILTAIVWLLLTATAGTLLAFNLRHAFLATPHLELLRIHANMGFIGWFMLLIMGVAAKLMPMFMLSHNVSLSRLSWTYYLVNAALILMGLTMYFEWGQAILLVAVMLLLIGVGIYGSFLARVYRQRVRKKLDIGMKHTAMAFLLVSVPVISGLLLVTGVIGEGSPLIATSSIYGISIILGFITALVMGQTYKTLPFIIWMNHYRSMAGKSDIPLPKDLYWEGVARWHFWTYAIGYTGLIIGLISGVIVIAQCGAACLALTAVLYVTNVSKIVFIPVHQSTIKHEPVSGS